MSDNSDYKTLDIQPKVKVTDRVLKDGTISVTALIHIKAPADFEPERLEVNATIQGKNRTP